MSDHSLPDEIISEILSPALKVSDELFCNNSDVSPFAKNSESTSAYLLVCKSWLRVATPLLYNTVILRSKAQAKALSIALAANKELGQFIKKLRVEGGYGSPMLIILKCSPKISDIFLSLEIYSSDNTGGLCKGLHFINPTRLILRDPIYKTLENKMVSQLLETLVETISKWDRLSVFDSPYFDESERSNIFIGALVKAQRLHTIVIPYAGGASWASSALDGCPLQCIHLKNTVSQETRSNLEKDPALRTRLKFTEKPSLRKPNAQKLISELPLIIPSLNPFFIPMSREAQQVQELVWSRVLYFAMSVPERADNPASRDILHRLPLLLVSKTFKRLGLPHYYTHVVLRSSSHVIRFASVLSDSYIPSIGPRVRSLVINYPTSSIHVDSTILSQTTGLERISQPFRSTWVRLNGEPQISWDAFETMAKSSGSTLREFSVHIKEHLEEQVSASIFSCLTVMQTLDWKCQASFILINIPEDGLQNLKELRISSTSKSFVTALSRMKLKYLERVVLSTNLSNVEIFLEAHGPKLVHLQISFGTLKDLTAKIFELCPNLHSLSLVWVGYLSLNDYITADDLYSSQAVPSLAKITMRLQFRTSKKDEVAAWEQFFMHFEPKCLPNLREIQVEGCEWPTNERDISKSFWVRWAEMLVQRGISLTDTSGTKWRPRLKVK
ncbi:hypothetical protein C8R45DRAFT_863664 [Mycena sanguinolenta]|nr:hypothetical protein C8R45DRAFT_863664 [Mycena sanguinolenta]